MGDLPNSIGCRIFPIVLLTLVLFTTLALTRPVLAATPDFTVSANPDKIIVPSGYWAETMLTFTSLNSFAGSIQLETIVGPDTGPIGAGFSTGMYLTPDGQVSTDLQLTAGTVPGRYNLTLTATSGPVSHSITLPISVSSDSSPDFITRLWGSYSTLQDRNISIQEQLVSLNGFSGQVSLDGAVMPSVESAPAVSFQPRIVTLSSNGQVDFNTLVSTSRTTPVGNYVVTVSASSTTISHTYQAVLMVGDYRPPSEDPPPNNNATTTSQSQSAGNTFIPSVPALASSTMSFLGSYWWQLSLVGSCVAGVVVHRRKTAR